MNLAETTRLWVTAVAASVLMTGVASAGTLDHIAQDKSIRIAYRDDAPPFSYKGKSGQPAGYMVDLCRAVAQKLAQPKLSTWSLFRSLRSTASMRSLRARQICCANRLPDIVAARASRFLDPDLCRRRRADHPQRRAAQLVRIGGQDQSARRDHHRAGIAQRPKEAGITADVMPASTHEEGLAMLDGGKVSAYFADRAILVFLAQQSAAPRKLLLADNYLTIEPYALALPHGDEAFVSPSIVP